MSTEPEELPAHAQAVHAVMGSIHRKLGDRSLEGEVAPPFAEFEQGPDGEAADAIDYHVAVRAMRNVFAYVMADGPEPLKAMKRFYALCKAYYPDLLRDMSDEQMATLFRETRAAVSARRMRMVTKKLEAAGFKGTHVRCQKSEAARRRFSAAQRGNQNRKKPAARAA